MLHSLPYMAGFWNTLPLMLFIPDVHVAILYCARGAWLLPTSSPLGKLSLSLL
jgi:hypothetical protein